MSDAWFKPHSYGYGATPSNWKGWAAVAAFIALLLASSLLTFGWEQADPSGRPAWKFAAWSAFVAIATIAFVWLCRAKTDGQWAWRWGK